MFAKITVLGIHPPSTLVPPPAPNNNVDVAFWEPRNVAKKKCFSVCARPRGCPQHCYRGQGGGCRCRRLRTIKNLFFCKHRYPCVCSCLLIQLMISISSAPALPTNIVTGGQGGGLDVSMFADARGRPRMNCTCNQECQGKRQRRPERSGKSKITYLERVPPSYSKNSMVLLAFLLASPPGSLKPPKTVLT